MGLSRASWEDLASLFSNGFYEIASPEYRQKCPIYALYGPISPLGQPLV